MFSSFTLTLKPIRAHKGSFLPQFPLPPILQNTWEPDQKSLHDQDFQLTSQCCLFISFLFTLPPASFSHFQLQHQHCSLQQFVASLFSPHTVISSSTTHSTPVFKGLWQGLLSWFLFLWKLKFLETLVFHTAAEENWFLSSVQLFLSSAYWKPQDLIETDGLDHPPQTPHWKHTQERSIERVTRMQRAYKQHEFS